MEKEFIPYEQVSSLIALGFNEPVIAHRQNGLNICLLKQPEVLLTDLSMILYQQAFRWFREKYHIHGEPFYKGGLTKQTSWYDYKIYSTIDWINTNPKQQWKTYEEAELACLIKLIEIVESKLE